MGCIYLLLMTEVMLDIEENFCNSAFGFEGSATERFFLRKTIMELVKYRLQKVALMVSIWLLTL